ncbi:MAG: hypothetical protein H6839_00500 [Planctomycetes bacterium]|nr:hypothetical protein [Planctomycetota bacterium]
MKKVLTMSLAALMLGALAMPAFAQDKKEEARSVLLKDTYKAMERRTEKTEDSNETNVKPKDQEMVLQNEKKTSNETKVIDILEVNADGKPTSIRIRWTEGTETTETTNMGQPPSDPVEEDSEMKGVSILFTWNADKKAYVGKLEEGDAELSGVKKELSKKDPLFNAFIPNREVKVGESWEPKEEDIKAMMGEDENVKLTKVSATCKAEEIVKEEGAELLRVSLEISMTGELQNEDLGKPTIEATRSGSFYWNIKEARVVRIEMENKAEFEAEVTHPQAGKMTLTVTVEGEEKMTETVGKVEEEDKDDGDDDEMK